MEKEEREKRKMKEEIKQEIRISKNK